MSYARYLFGGQALMRLLHQYGDVRTVLDVGSGVGQHADVMREHGKEVTTISMIPPADVVGDFMQHEFPIFDAIWASHVLEHQLDVNAFLKKCYRTLKPDGVFAVTVPPLKHEVVGGHLNLFNSGTLLYNLILAGFDCSRARVSPCYVAGPMNFPYNLSVIVRKKEAVLPALEMDHGDIERIAQYFPFRAYQGFDGSKCAVNW